MSGTLEELWVSYNQIASLDGIAVCGSLTTLYIANNMIKSWNELDKLVSILCNFTRFSMCCNPVFSFCCIANGSCVNFTVLDKIGWAGAPP